MADTIPVILESCADSGGARTVLQFTLLPGATVSRHFHTRFKETFTVSTGRLTLWTGTKKNVLLPGESLSVKRNSVHHYLVGEEPAVVTIVLEPGDKNFEKAIEILAGAQQDGTYDQLTPQEGADETFMAAILALTDSNMVDNDRIELEKAGLLPDSQKTHAAVKELEMKYCGKQN
jgi:quercetin dioxygenase-like cupin family protein